MSRATERSKQMVKHLASKFVRQSAWKLVLWFIGLVAGLGWPALLFFVMIAVIINVTGSFFLGSYTGVHLTGSQQQYAQEDAHIKQVYQTAANQWKNGLDTQQQSIVRSYQVYLPTSVLLTLGKFVDNYQKPNQAKRAQAYYALLAPTYTWVKGQGEDDSQVLDNRTGKERLQAGDGNFVDVVYRVGTKRSGCLEWDFYKHVDDKDDGFVWTRWNWYADHGTVYGQ